MAFTARFTTRASEVQIDATVLGFTLVVSVLTGDAVRRAARAHGAARARRGDEAGELARGRRLRPAARARLLVVSQVAFSFMLLIAAGLMLRSFWKLQQVDPGFRTDNVLTAGVALNWSKYDTDDKVRALRRASCCASSRRIPR